MVAHHQTVRCRCYPAAVGRCRGNREPAELPVLIVDEHVVERADEREVGQSLLV